MCSSLQAVCESPRRSDTLREYFRVWESTCVTARRHVSVPSFLVKSAKLLRRHQPPILERDGGLEGGSSSS